ncbi:MAG: transposase [Elusimicrobia bacterium]|nr:transposase [Elusimicrobiota bacterium]
MKSAFHAKKRPLRRRDRKGGRPLLPPRQCFDALLWHLASGLPWSCLPERFGSPRTVHRRLRRWPEQDGLGTAWRRYLEHLPAEKVRQWSAVFGSRPGRKRGFWYWK